jgi:peptidyl-prolyl cis-trans isomerase B (cyclophilin B)
MKNFILVAVILVLVLIVFGRGIFSSKENNSSDKKLTKTEEVKKETSKEVINNKKNEMEKENIELAKEYKEAVIKTSLGDITMAFFNEDSPITVGNFIKLAKDGFYDETKFHRVITDFMIQGGDPNSKSDDWSNHGMGGPGYAFEDEFNDHKIVKGSIAMANSGPNTNGSQFFIVTASATPHLDGVHTNFGKVVSGMDVVDKIEQVKTNQNDHPIDDVTINSIELK